MPAHAMMKSGTSLSVDVVNTVESEHSAESVVSVEGEEATVQEKVMSKDRLKATASCTYRESRLRLTT